MPKATQTPTPVLKEGVIYIGDNGEAICIHCAGMSAKYTGRDRSGQLVHACTEADAKAYLEMFKENPIMEELLPRVFSCECRRTTYDITS